MSTRRYTAEQLFQLRASPLVKKPDNLPPIEQWIEYVYVDGSSREKLRIPHSEVQTQQLQQAAGRINTRQPRPATGGDASPMGNFSTGQRPSLVQTRTTGSRSDDIVLGPPKTAFASSRSITRVSTFNDTQPTGEQAVNDDLDIARVRPFGERQAQRKSTNIGEKDLRGERESWTATRDRKAFGEADHARTDSNPDRTIRRREGDPERRNGERQENRWTQKDERRPNGERQGGWRDHDNTRRERWDRPDTSEREPEWFDEPVVTSNQDDDFGETPKHTQQDFEKWKAAMAANNKDATTPAKETPLVQKEPSKPKEALKLEGVVDKSFGGFGVKSPEPTEQAQPKPTATAKAKPSRFASMFKKEDSPIDLPPLPDTTPTPVELGAGAANKEDQEGFKRIMQMLGKPTLDTTPPPSAEPRSPASKNSANGTRRKSRFFDATPKSPENMQASLPPPQTDMSLGRQDAEVQQQLPPNASPFPQQVHPTHQRTNTADGYSGEPSQQGLPKGGTSTPENNIQNLLASQRAQRQAAPTNKDTQFLLGLLQGHSSRPTSQATRPDSDFPLWISPPPEPHAPKSRAPPPSGQIDEHFLRSAAQPSAPNPIVDTRQPQRAPPGFDEQALFMQQQYQQRQQFSERQISSQQFDISQARRVNVQPPGMHGLPPQALHQQMASPSVVHGPTDLPFMPGPPPGFSANMRPQGFANMPNMFPQAQQGQPGPRQHVPIGFPPGMIPGQPVPPPGFGRVLPPAGPPGIMPMLPNGLSGPSGGLGRGGMFDQRR